MQVSINPIAGNTFPLVLRAFLRQDPDVMMIGEIRDLETAQIAPGLADRPSGVQHAAHNDSAGAVTRLVDMGVEPYLVASTLEAVLGQRLVRTICQNCKEAYDPDDDTLRSMDLKREDIGGRHFCYGRGCQICSNTGYKGRRGSTNTCDLNELRELIQTRGADLVSTARRRARWGSDHARRGIATFSTGKPPSTRCGATRKPGGTEW